MTVKSPPVFLQSGSYVAQDLRQMISGQAAPGVIHPTDFAISAGGGMSVNVSAGSAFVAGTETTTQGTYYVVNDAPVNLVVAASNPTNARNDLVILRVRDAAISGAFNDAALVVVTGVASGTPVDPAVPNNSVILGRLVIPALASSVIAGYITDIRQMAIETWPSQATTGLIGAQNASRYVGATASGAPTTGTFLRGDVVVDQLGCIHVCQTAGTPGTWSSPPMGTLAYAQVLADQSGVTSADIAGMSVTVTVGAGRRLRLSAEILLIDGTPGGVWDVVIFEVATQLQQGRGVSTGSAGTTLACSVILTPSAGVHTYKVSVVRATGAGTALIAMSATHPGFLLCEDIGV